MPAAATLPISGHVRGGGGNNVAAFVQHLGDNMAFYIRAETRDALIHAGVLRQYLPAMATVTESLLVMGDTLPEIIAKWRQLKPEWWYG
jgi:hypothetical protein